VNVSVPPVQGTAGSAEFRLFALGESAAVKPHRIARSVRAQYFSPLSQNGVPVIASTQHTGISAHSLDGLAVSP
jgi:hypothetical protein